VLKVDISTDMCYNNSAFIYIEIRDNLNDRYFLVWKMHKYFFKGGHFMVKVNCEKKLKGVSKDRQNEIAVNMSVKNTDHIYYDINYPLVINSESKVMEIFVLEDEENEEVNVMVTTLDVPKTIRVVFKDECPKYSEQRESGDATPYTVDIRTTMSLEEFQDRLVLCNDESDIEDIADEL